MTTEPATPAPKRNGALTTLWVLGPIAIIGGLIAYQALKASAREKARIDAMYDDMLGIDGAGGIDYTAANVALGVAAIGVLLLIAAIIIQAARKP